MGLRRAVTNRNFLIGTKFGITRNASYMYEYVHISYFRLISFELVTESAHKNSPHRDNTFYFCAELGTRDNCCDNLSSSFKVKNCGLSHCEFPFCLRGAANIFPTSSCHRSFDTLSRCRLSHR